MDTTVTDDALRSEAQNIHAYRVVDITHIRALVNDENTYVCAHCLTRWPCDPVLQAMRAFREKQRTDRLIADAALAQERYDEDELERYADELRVSAKYAESLERAGVDTFDAVEDSADSILDDPTGITDDMLPPILLDCGNCGMMLDGLEHEVADGRALYECPNCGAQNEFMTLEDVTTVEVEATVEDTMEEDETADAQEQAEAKIDRDLARAFRDAGTQLGDAFVIASFASFANRMATLCHDRAVAKGFPQPTGYDHAEMVICKLGLAAAELGEAMGDVQKRNDAHVGEEIADCFIRLFDLCGALDIAVGAEVAKKLSKNVARPPMHGKRI